MKIEFRDPQGQFLYFEVKKGEATIGRSRKCDITLPFDSLSRTHARIDILEGDDATVTDLGSSNGTFLNENKINPNMPEGFSSLFSFTLGDGVQMRLMEEDEDFPQGASVTIIRNESKRSAPAQVGSGTQSAIATQMVSRKSKAAPAKRVSRASSSSSEKENKGSSSNKAGSSQIIRISIIILAAAAVYLYLSE